MFETVIPTATSLWRLVEHVHETTAKAYEANLYGTVYRCTSYRDRGEDTVKVLDVASGAYTLYARESGVWRRMEGY